MSVSEQFSLKWNNHTSHLLGVFDSLLQSESLVDVTLSCDGHTIRAHKLVLSACSPYFKTLFEDHTEAHPIVILKDVRYSELRSVVQFMYRGEIEVEQADLDSLFATAETLMIRGLTGSRHRTNSEDNTEPSQTKDSASGARVHNSTGPSSSAGLTDAQSSQLVGSLSPASFTGAAASNHLRHHHHQQQHQQQQQHLTSSPKRKRARLVSAAGDGADSSDQASTVSREHLAPASGANGAEEVTMAPVKLESEENEDINGSNFETGALASANTTSSSSYTTITTTTSTSNSESAGSDTVYLCRDCGATYRHRVQLNKHHRRVHSGAAATGAVDTGASFSTNEYSSTASADHNTTDKNGLATPLTSTPRLLAKRSSTIAVGSSQSSLANMSCNSLLSSCLTLGAPRLFTPTSDNSSMVGSDGSTTTSAAATAASAAAAVAIASDSSVAFQRSPKQHQQQHHHKAVLPLPLFLGAPSLLAAAMKASPQLMAHPALCQRLLQPPPPPASGLSAAAAAPPPPPPLPLSQTSLHNVLSSNNNGINDDDDDSDDLRPMPLNLSASAAVVINTSSSAVATAAADAASAADADVKLPLSVYTLSALRSQSAVAAAAAAAAAAAGEFLRASHVTGAGSESGCGGGSGGGDGTAATRAAAYGASTAFADVTSQQPTLVTSAASPQPTLTPTPPATAGAGTGGGANAAKSNTSSSGGSSRSHRGGRKSGGDTKHSGARGRTRLSHRPSKSATANTSDSVTAAAAAAAASGGVTILDCTTPAGSPSLVRPSSNTSTSSSTGASTPNAAAIGGDGGGGGGGDVEDHDRTPDDDDSREQITCKYCVHVFDSVDQLMDHMAVHQGERPFRCEYCGKAFKFRHHLKDHHRIHTGERPFDCKICGKSFARSSILKTHTKIHRQEAGAGADAGSPLLLDTSGTAGEETPAGTAETVSLNDSSGAISDGEATN